jgi:hypothetical protein
MKTLERARLALREYLLQNKERVSADLDAMRTVSEGKDIFNYIENFSNFFTFDILEDYPKFGNLGFNSNNCCILQDINSLDLPQTTIYPPPKIENKRKKDSENSSESFFLIILHYVRSSKSCIFI